MTNELWVVLESFHPSSLGLVQKAVSLARERALMPCALYFGSEAEAPQALAQAGSEKVYIIEADTSNINMEQPALKAMLELYESCRPQVILFEYTGFTGNLAPSFAAAIDRGITADCTQLEWDAEHGLLQIRPTFGGRKTAVNRSTRPPYIATVRKGVFPYSPSVSRLSPQVLRHPLPSQEPVFKLLEILEGAGTKGSLADARILLSGGLGLGSKANFQRLELLAQRCGARVSASRAAVGAGYTSYSNQVGQTGQTVSPDYYISFGISGAVQHLSGILGSGTIIAINKDPKAPIHDYSDFSIVADCNELITALLDSIE